MSVNMCTQVCMLMERVFRLLISARKRTVVRRGAGV